MSASDSIIIIIESKVLLIRSTKSSKCHHGTKPQRCRPRKTIKQEQLNSENTIIPLEVVQWSTHRDDNHNNYFLISSIEPKNKRENPLGEL